MKTQVIEYKGYQGTIEPSFEDGVLHGKILHIVDLVTYEAETIPGLEQAFRDSVDEYLEFCAEEGVSPDKPFSGTFNVRLGPDLHRQLALAASREGMKINETLKKVVETWLRDCPDGFRVVHHHNHMHEHFHSGENETVTYRGEIDFQMPPQRPKRSLRVVQ